MLMMEDQEPTVGSLVKIKKGGSNDPFFYLNNFYDKDFNPIR